ncbi:uracil-DNA glycosylase family protein [Flavobacterium sp. H122]|uniref:uracil-DNA glycosylase family protein n=1 Tax=Flavobacterium sp. H122 TaxID=2529860 RepID=UPI0010AB2E12|nr:uracil-DNA glycosylase family protein [Flavobacterium sp. H122]
MALETHPNWFYDFSPMKTLILGSFPPHQSKHAFPFYYPNKQNRFWKVMSQISGIALQADFSDTEKVIEERKAIMRKLSVGIHDVALQIVRKNNSSLDNNIEIVTYQDIVSIVQNHTEMERILLLGFSAKNSAAHSFLRYLEAEKIKSEFPSGFRIKANNSFSVFIDARKIECVILNSTSSASAVQVPQLVEQFRKYLV